MVRVYDASLALLHSPFRLMMPPAESKDKDTVRNNRGNELDGRNAPLAV